MPYDVSPVRQANADEAASVATRTEKERGFARRFARDQRREAIMVSLIVTVVSLAAMFLPFSRDVWVFRAFESTFALGFFVIGVLGVRNASRRARARENELNQNEHRRATGVVEHRFTATRLVTASEADGDYRCWLLFELEDAGWVVFDEAQFIDLNPPPVWNRSNRVTLDGDGVVLHVEERWRRSAGAPPSAGSARLHANRSDALLVTARRCRENAGANR